MNSRVFVRQQARSDIVELAVSIGLESEIAASRFLIAVEQTLSLLADFPDIGALFLSPDKRLKALRVFRIKGFPNHLAFDQQDGDRIDVVRVIHGSRDLDVALGEREFE